MRNWNIENLLLPEHSHQKLRAYLWGIETKTALKTSSERGVLLRAYLWGIETNFMLCILPVALSLLRAYLWGIETLTKIFRKRQFLSCEPTYEELKPGQWIAKVGILPSLRAYLWGIETGITFLMTAKAVGCEPTYEELKPYLRDVYALPVVSCEPTYEELKLPPEIA